MATGISFQITPNGKYISAYLYYSMTKMGSGEFKEFQRGVSGKSGMLIEMQSLGGGVAKMVNNGIECVCYIVKLQKQS